MIFILSEGKSDISEHKGYLVLGEIHFGSYVHKIQLAILGLAFYL